MKLSWLTDIHLSHAPQTAIDNLILSMNQSQSDAFVITGDIGESETHQRHLRNIESKVSRKLYVVLGNHDFYGGSIPLVREGMKQLQNDSTYIRYLPTVTYEKLTSTVALVGHDSWYDAIIGDPITTRFILNDFQFIKEYHDITKGDLFNNFDKNRQKVIELSRKLSREGVEHIQNGIKEAVRFATTIIVASHPVPFQESHIFDGRTGSPSAQPWYTTKLLGDLLMSAAKTYSNIKFISISGHTHGEYHNNILPNLEVHVGGAEYCSPKLQKTTFNF